MNPENISSLIEATPASSRAHGFPTLHFFLLLVVAACLFFAALGRLPLQEPDEGRNAEVAREMLVKGDWITPHFDGFTYLDKPPVYFWLVAASFKLGGFSEAAARFSSALAALGTMLLAWFMARRMFGSAAGLCAGIVFATAPLAAILAREVIFDMTLTFLVTTAMVCYWIGETEGGRRTLWDILFFAAMGAATLTKGPVGFVLPLLAVGAYQALRGRLGKLKELNWRLGLAVFLAVTLPWFIAVSLQHPDFPKYAFWQESLERFATGHAHRSGPFYYYFLIYLAGFLPWSFFMLYAAYHRLKRWKELRQERNSAVLFLLSWAGVIFIFFTFSRSKLPAYFLPAIIPLSILMAVIWTQAGPGPQDRSPDWLTGGFATLIALGIFVAMAPQLERLAFFHTRFSEKLPSGALALLNPSLLYTGIILAALGIIGRDLCARERRKAPSALMLVLISSTFPLLLVRWFHPLELFASANSSRRLAETILASPVRSDPLYGYHYFRTSLPFYLRRPVGLVTSDGDELTSNYVVSRWPEIKENVEFPQTRSREKICRMPLMLTDREWEEERASKPVLVIVREGEEAQLNRAVPRMNPLWSGWKYSVWQIPASSAGATPPPN